MHQKEIFLKDKENCKIPFTHIEDGKIDPGLAYIDELFGAADVLSIENAKKHERNLWLLSFFGTVIVIFFLLYDEAELHWLVFGCLSVIIIIFYTNQLAKRSECHRKYTQYRVLAESLRVQYFISLSGIDKNVSELLPWSTKKGIEWIYELLSELPPIRVSEKRPIIDCWIRDQRDYHDKKFKESKRKEKINSTITNRILWITVITYVIAAIFEIYILNIPSGKINYDFLGNILLSLKSWGIMVSYGQTEMLRSILKIILGTLSAIALFSGSYYGKMSLPNIREDHRRMVMLYDFSENAIAENNGQESEELVLDLAREFLIENSTWYAYQKTNTPDLTFK